MTDRSSLRAFLAEVDGGDVIALAPSGAIYDQGDGHEEARRVAQQRGVADPVWLFWHQQAAASFDATGDLAAPLRINWGGDHARVAAVLARLPERYRVVDHGPGGVFEIERVDAAERASEPYPDPTDPSATKAVKARIQRVTSRGHVPTPADWSWLNRVLVEGDVTVQGAVVRWLAGSPELTETAFETLMAGWAAIYTKAPTDVLITDLLRTLHARGDARLGEVVATAARRKRWTFFSGVSHFLAEHGGPEHEALLLELAQRPGEYAHTPGDRTAIDAWLRVRSEVLGVPVATLALVAVPDPGFDRAARRHLVQRAAAEIAGDDDLNLVGLLEYTGSAPEVREAVADLFANQRWVRVHEHVRGEVAGRLLALARSGSVRFGEKHDEVVAGLASMAAGGPPPPR